MSNVIARFRGETDCQCLTDARKMRGDLMEWAFKEENIPKKYRNSYVPQMKALTDKIVKTIRQAQYDGFPTSEEKLRQRRAFIDIAANTIVDLWQELQSLDDLRRSNGGLNLNKLEPILTEIYNLQFSLRNWAKNSKVQSK